jgi:hypothetical protein
MGSTSGTMRSVVMEPLEDVILEWPTWARPIPMVLFYSSFADADAFPFALLADVPAPFPAIIKGTIMRVHPAGVHACV